MQTTIYSDTAEISQKQSSVISLRAVGSIAKLQARRKRVESPKHLTACVSEISLCSSRRPYHCAVKSFAEVYAAYQEYLAPAQHFAPAYEPVTEAGAPHCGCLSDELTDSVSGHAEFNEEIIESCGYFGWLQRC